MFSNVEFPVECPQCKKQIKMKMSSMTKGKEIVCPKCKTKIILDSKGDSIADSVKRLDRTLKRLRNKNFDIK